jgi:hypothetical protein
VGEAARNAKPKSEQEAHEMKKAERIGTTPTSRERNSR